MVQGCLNARTMCCQFSLYALVQTAAAYCCKTLSLIFLQRKWNQLHICCYNRHNEDLQIRVQRRHGWEKEVKKSNRWIKRLKVRPGLLVVGQVTNIRWFNHLMQSELSTCSFSNKLIRNLLLISNKFKKQSMKTPHISLIMLSDLHIFCNVYA